MPGKHPERDFLDRFVAGALSGRERLQVGWHLSNCRECRKQVEGSEEGRAATAGMSAQRSQPLPDGSAYESAITRSLAMLAERQASLERERERAPQLYEDLARHPPARQKVLIRNARRFQSWGLAQYLIERCAQTWGSDPQQAEALAALALTIADQFEPPLYQERILNDLKGRCWVHIGTCRRIGDDLRAAADAFDRAGELLAAGTEDPVEWALYLHRRGTLHMYQRRLNEAEPLLRRAIASFRRVGDPHLAGRVMVTLAELYHLRCEPERAIATLQKARKVLDWEREPKVGLIGCHNLLHYLIDAERYMEARSLLAKTRELYELYADSMLRQKLLWLQGRIACGLGQEQQAEALLERARNNFIAQGKSGYVAVISLDLAEVYVRQGRTAEVKQLVQETLPIFQALDIGREALAAMLLFREAVQTEKVTVAMLREVAQRLRGSAEEPRPASSR